MAGLRPRRPDRAEQDTNPEPGLKERERVKRMDEDKERDEMDYCPETKKMLRKMDKAKERAAKTAHI